METSKASYDLHSETSGFIHIVGQLGTEYKYGETITLVFDSQNKLTKFIQSRNNEKRSNTDLVISKVEYDIKLFEDFYQKTKEKLSSRKNPS